MSTSIAYFDALYRDDADPWRVRSRWYEQRKRALLLASLPRPAYRRALEPGCGTGELTLALAERCGELSASDASSGAVRIARARVAHLPHVQVSQQVWPAVWPGGVFDLIVLSEWAYYLSSRDLGALVDACRASLSADGTLIACHWRPDFDQRRQTTEEVHAALGAVKGWHRQLRHEERDFLLEAWSPQAGSVAQQEGIA